MRSVLFVGAVVSTVLVGACASSTGDSTAPRKSGLPAMNESVSAPAPILSPDATETTALLTGLRAIDSVPRVDDPERFVDWSRTICQEIRSGASMSALVASVTKRFSARGTAVTRADAPKVVAVVERSFCTTD